MWEDAPLHLITATLGQTHLRCVIFCYLLHSLR